MRTKAAENLQRDAGGCPFHSRRRAGIYGRPKRPVHTRTLHGPSRSKPMLCIALVISAHAATPGAASFQSWQQISGSGQRKRHVIYLVRNTYYFIRRKPAAEDGESAILPLLSGTSVICCNIWYNTTPSTMPETAIQSLDRLVCAADPPSGCNPKTCHCRMAKTRAFGSQPFSKIWMQTRRRGFRETRAATWTVL